MEIMKLTGNTILIVGIVGGGVIRSAGR
jgi:preprotein translocase subunit Sss1